MHLKAHLSCHLPEAPCQQGAPVWQTCGLQTVPSGLDHGLRHTWGRASSLDWPSSGPLPQTKAKAARWSISKTGKFSVSLTDSESTDITVHAQPPTLTHFSWGKISNCHLMTKIKLEVPGYEEIKLTN